MSIGEFNQLEKIAKSLDEISRGIWKLIKILDKDSSKEESDKR